MNTQNVSSTSSILSTSSVSSSSTQMRSNTMIAENIDIESRLVGSNDTDDNLYDLDLTSDNENPIDDDISENESTHSNAKRKDRETINDNANLQLASTIISMHDMQLQMFTTIQEMQTKINELHVNLKIGSEDNIKKELKWIEDAIGEAIYAAIEKTKYPTDEHLMKICYDTLLDTKKDEFQ
ncbi:940_t:CDS:2, partial [Cetraspora pellucida]